MPKKTSTYPAVVNDPEAPKRPFKIPPRDNQKFAGAKWIHSRANGFAVYGPIDPVPRFTGETGVTIYGLVDPRDNTIRYVGQTRNPRQRLEQHQNTPLNSTVEWIRILQSRGLRPRMVPLGRAKPCTANRWEKHWTTYWLKRGCLYNRIKGQLPIPEVLRREKKHFQVSPKARGGKFRDTLRTKPKEAQKLSGKHLLNIANNRRQKAMRDALKSSRHTEASYKRHLKQEKSRLLALAVNPEALEKTPTRAERLKARRKRRAEKRARAYYAKLQRLHEEKARLGPLPSEVFRL